MYRLYVITDGPSDEHDKIVCYDNDNGKGNGRWFISNHPVDVALHARSHTSLEEIQDTQSKAHLYFNADVGLQFCGLDGKWRVCEFRSQMDTVNAAIELD